MTELTDDSVVRVTVDLWHAVHEVHDHHPMTLDLGGMHIGATQLKHELYYKTLTRHCTPNGKIFLWRVFIFNPNYDQFTFTAETAKIIPERCRGNMERFMHDLPILRMFV